MSMKNEVEHHSQASSQSTMSYEISRTTEPPKNNNIVIEHQQSRSHVDEQDPRKKWYDDMRGSIMVVAVLVASVTYTSGLSPPGGFWQDDNGDHKAGSAILQDRFRDRYTTFFYANATAFMTSLVIIVLLMSDDFYHETSKVKVVMLYFSMVLDLISLMIAYAAGCGRNVSISIYVIALGAVVLLIVVYLARVLPIICEFARKLCPCNCIVRLAKLTQS